jgi:hypothetical protein
MKKRILINTLIATSITIGLTACGGGGGGGSDASFADAETLIPIDVNCTANPTQLDIDSYITLNSGDVIVKDEENTTISTYHDIDGNKKVCRVTGSAHIIRE